VTPIGCGHAWPHTSPADGALSTPVTTARRSPLMTFTSSGGWDGDVSRARLVGEVLAQTILVQRLSGLRQPVQESPPVPAYSLDRPRHAEAIRDFLRKVTGPPQPVGQIGGSERIRQTFR